MKHKLTALFFFLFLAATGFAQQQFSTTNLVCWDSAGHVKTLVRESYRVNGLGYVVKFYYPKSNVEVTPPAGTVGACVRRVEADSLGQFIKIIKTISGT